MSIINNLLSQIQKDLGSQPDQIDQSKIVRFSISKKKKNKDGWVRFSTWIYNSREYAVAFYGDWAIHSDVEYLTWKSWTKEEELQDKNILSQLKIEQEELKKQQAIDREKDLEELRQAFLGFKPLDRSNEYFVRKKMTNSSFLFQNKKGDLVLPAYKDVNRDLVFGYQTVNKYGKFFKTGSQVRGAFNFFGIINQETEVIYLCEGIATADSIYQATQIPTVSCFSANNIPNVVKYFKETYQGINIVVACDVDKNQASQKNAFKAKAKFGDIIIVKPKFDKSSQLSDFNDLYVSTNLDETKKQLAFDETDFTHVEFLGFKEGKYFFYSSKTKELQDFTIEKMKSGNLIQLAPTNYWALKFVPKLDKNGEPTTFCDWNLSTEKIVSKQNQIGAFSAEKIKGVGSWVDNNKHVLNLGDKLLVDFKPRSFGKHSDLNKFYKPNHNKVLEFSQKPDYDFSPLINATKLIDFSSDRDRIIVLGYIAICQMFTTQRWRPHLWITADKGTGKSSLLEFLGTLIQNSNRYQDSTAAGLRQEIKCDSKVCIIDEAEGESYKTKQLIELARQSSSGAGTSIVRGTATGHGFSYSPELTFLFASIRIGELTPADQSRILEVHMKKKPVNNFEQNKKRESLMYDAQKLGVDLFSYMNQNLNLFNELLETSKVAMKKQGLDNRFVDQMSPILTGYLMLDLDADQNEVAEKLLKLDESEPELEEEDTDQFDFYDHFLNLVIKEGVSEYTLKQVFEKNLNEPGFLNNTLERLGIYFLPQKRRFFVTKNPNLSSLFKKNTSFKGYFSQMLNSKYFEKTVQKTKNKPKRGFLVGLQF